MNILYKNTSSLDYSIHAFGKTWKSIAACCRNYKVNYHSVKQYMSNNKCDAETAIQYYINYNKNSNFCFRKKKWNTIKECCEHYNINYESFIICKANWGLPLEEALKKYIEMGYNKNFKFNGVTYNSFIDCCNAYGVNPVSVDHFRKNRKLMRRRGLNAYLKYKENRSTAFRFANIEYPSFTDCCRCYGLNASLIRAYSERNKVSLYVSLIHYILKEKDTETNEERIQSELLKPIKYKAVLYPSILLCCEALRIDIEEVFIRKMQCRKKIETIIKDLDQADIRMNREQETSVKDGFIFKKKYYTSLSDFCNEYGINEKYVRCRLGRGRYSFDSTLRYYVKTAQ